MEKIIWLKIIKKLSISAEYSTDRLCKTKIFSVATPIRAHYLPDELTL